MAAPKGYQPPGGSRKGIPNKKTAALKEMILTALESAGGVKYLTEQAKANPSAFLTLIGKVLPLQVSGEGGAPIQVQVVTYDHDHPPA